MSNSKTIAIVIAVCAGLGILMIGLCAGLIYLGYKNADSAVSPRIDAMFAAIENKTFADTYETETTQELRNVVSKEQYATLGDAITLRLGKLESKSLQGFRMKKLIAGSYVEVSYDATFENGKGTITATLKQDGGEWKFVNFRVNSPLFAQDVASAKCPSCGEPHSANAKFCPSCGSAISHADQQITQQDDPDSEASASEQAKD